MELEYGKMKEITLEEANLVQGGSKGDAQTVMIVGGAIIAGIVAPVTCGGSLAAYVAGASVGYGLMIGGAIL